MGPRRLGWCARFVGKEKWLQTAGESGEAMNILKEAACGSRKFMRLSRGSGDAVHGALSEQNSKYLERPPNHSDRPGKMAENQWPRNRVLTFWQSKRICSDNAGESVDEAKARYLAEHPEDPEASRLIIVQYRDPTRT